MARHPRMRQKDPELHGLPIFADCSPRTMKVLSGLGTRMRVAAGQQLTSAGKRGAEVLIVVSGTATCLVQGVEEARFGPGDFFGEVATLDGGPRTATVVAATDMEVLVMNKFRIRDAGDVVTRGGPPDVEGHGPPAAEGQRQSGGLTVEGEADEDARVMIAACPSSPSRFRPSDTEAGGGRFVGAFVMLPAALFVVAGGLGTLRDRRWRQPNRRGCSRQRGHHREPDAFTGRGG